MKYSIPSEFRFQDPSRYPQDNVEDFEWWCSNNIKDTEGDRYYLPITWTAYYKKHKYGQEPRALEHLQKYLKENLKRDRKYWTIVQWDDGILNDLSQWDVRVYAMGSPGDYQLPLICQPHAYTPVKYKKDIFCSFVGRVTHPIRQRIVEQLTGKDGYFIQTKPVGMLQFCEILSRSEFVIAARGYGATSFRICEALQYNATPIYLSDTFLHPHGLKEHARQYITMPDIVDSIYGYMQTVRIGGSNPKPYSEKHYSDFYTYYANKELILKDLNNITK